MRLRARFTALFGILSALAVVFLVLVSDATVRRSVEDRVSDRFRRELFAKSLEAIDPPGQKP